MTVWGGSRKDRNGLLGHHRSVTLVGVRKRRLSIRLEGSVPAF